MKFYIHKLSIRTQLLLFLTPLLTLFLILNSYFQYKNDLSTLHKREIEKKENVKSGIIQFIDYYDLSLALLEKKVEERIEYLSNRILTTYSKNLETSNLDSLKLLLEMDVEKEGLYIINRDGIIINTTKKTDLGLNFFAFGKTYEDFLNTLWVSKELSIERVGLEINSKNPIKYAYQAINDDFILEIGIMYDSFEDLIKGFNEKIASLSKRYSNIISIDLFGATEYFPSRNKESVMLDELKPIAKKCYENQIDTSLVTQMNGVETTLDLIFLPIRNSNYFDGYILQIISDNSLKEGTLWATLKEFLVSILLGLLFLIPLLLFITRKITNPLRFLVTSLEKVGSGENIGKVEINGSLETEILAKEFNQMIKKIASYYSSLELKIKSRTLELNKKNEKLQKLSEERGLLIKEIHHRVKNNLQIISSLLSLQAKKIEDKEIAAVFEKSKSRVIAIALLHEKLYKNSNFILVGAYNYLQDLILTLKDTISEKIEIRVYPTDVQLNSTESISVGLITNEAILNSIKHGFSEKENGKIDIKVSHTKTDIILKISNNGEKLLENFDIENHESLGITIIQAFAEKLDGTILYDNTKDGVTLTMTFPKKFSAEFN